MELNNKTLRLSESYDHYVLLVTRTCSIRKDETVKGIGRRRFMKGYIPCAVKPKGMLKFKTEKAALDWWDKYGDVDKELRFYRVIKMSITYSLDI